MAKRRKGSIDRSESFDEFLGKDGLLAETEDAAIKEIIADQIKVAMDKKGPSKTAMAAYSAKAQPYLDAIAESAFTSQSVRDWLIKGTPLEADYIGSNILIDEQRTLRWRNGPTKQPFWANYWCGRDSRCTCRIENSKGLESDAIFFLRNNSNRVLGVHIEFKHPKETFKFGQPEAYPLRAACFARTYNERPTVNAHHDWTTVIFCGGETLSDPRISYFQRAITHAEARLMISGYPIL